MWGFPSKAFKGKSWRRGGTDGLPAVGVRKASASASSLPHPSIHALAVPNPRQALFLSLSLASFLPSFLGFFLLTASGAKVGGRKGGEKNRRCPAHNRQPPRPLPGRRSLPLPASPANTGSSAEPNSSLLRPQPKPGAGKRARARKSQSGTGEAGRAEPGTPRRAERNHAPFQRLCLFDKGMWGGVTLSLLPREDSNEHAQLGINGFPRKIRKGGQVFLN